MNPIAIEIGPFSVYWYSLFVLGGFLAGYFLLFREFKKQKLSLTFLSDYFFYLVPISLLGARIYYVIFEWNSYKDNLGDIFAIWNGGLAIHGGIIAGAIFSIYYTKRHKINSLKFLDMVVPCLILGQAIGRWGNFFNQEAFGRAVELDTLRQFLIPSFIIDGMNIDGVYHHPTFYYEFIACLLGVGIILFIRSRKNTKIGEQTAVYFIVYGISRFFIESLRTDSLLIGDFRVAQIISVMMLIGGVILFIRQKKTTELYNYIEKPKKKKR